MISNNYLIFIKAAEYKNFNMTAKKMNLTPSAISHAISKLEDELGLTLFIRNKKGVILTKQGKEILEYAKKVVDQEKELLQKSSDLKGVVNGSITIGAMSSICSHWLPQIITSFKKKYPEVKIIVKQSGYMQVRNWIENGEVDLGFLVKTLCGNLNSVTLYQDELICFLPSDFETKNKNWVNIEELQHLELVQQTNENSIDTQIFLDKHNCHFTSSFNIEDDQSLIAIVESGLGFCIVPKLAAKGYGKNLVKKSFNPKEYRDLCIAWHQDYLMLPLTKIMKDHIIEYSKTFLKK